MKIAREFARPVIQTSCAPQRSMSVRSRSWKGSRRSTGPRLPLWPMAPIATKYCCSCDTYTVSRAKLHIQPGFPAISLSRIRHTGHRAARSPRTHSWIFGLPPWRLRTGAKPRGIQGEAGGFSDLAQNTDGPARRSMIVTRTEVPMRAGQPRLYSCPSSAGSTRMPDLSRVRHGDVAVAIDCWLGRVI